MSEAMKVSGMPQSAERIERVLEVVRRELGKSAQETDWQSLIHHWAQGVEETEVFASAMGSAESTDGGAALVHVFLLRQLEISMQFIAKLAQQVTLLQNRVGELTGEMEEEETMV